MVPSLHKQKAEIHYRLKTYKKSLPTPSRDNKLGFGDRNHFLLVRKWCVWVSLRVLSANLLPHAKCNQVCKSMTWRNQWRRLRDVEGLRSILNLILWRCWRRRYSLDELWVVKQPFNRLMNIQLIVALVLVISELLLNPTNYFFFNFYLIFSLQTLKDLYIKLRSSTFIHLNLLHFFIFLCSFDDSEINIYPNK